MPDCAPISRLKRAAHTEPLSAQRLPGGCEAQLGMDTRGCTLSGKYGRRGLSHPAFGIRLLSHPLAGSAFAVSFVKVQLRKKELHGGTGGGSPEGRSAEAVSPRRAHCASDGTSPERRPYRPRPKAGLTRRTPCKAQSATAPRHCKRSPYVWKCIWTGREMSDAPVLLVRTTAAVDCGDLLFLNASYLFLGFCHPDYCCLDNIRVACQRLTPTPQDDVFTACHPAR